MRDSALGLRSKSEKRFTVADGRTPADIGREMPSIPTGGYRSLYDHAQRTNAKPKATEATKEKPKADGE